MTQHPNPISEHRDSDIEESLGERKLQASKKGRLHLIKLFSPKMDINMASIPSIFQSSSTSTSSVFLYSFRLPQPLRDHHSFSSNKQQTLRMQFTASLLALAMAATSMAAVSTPLEVRAATSCSTPVCTVSFHILKNQQTNKLSGRKGTLRKGHCLLHRLRCRGLLQGLLPMLRPIQG